ncbi:MAG: HK97 gp10 family phage protein [Ruminococcus sp.]|nr:HK97 gp10 family phage protein [Ruminococcus sp.]
MGADVTYDLSGFSDFFARLRQAASGDFRKELEGFMQALGTEFLRVVEDEIIRRKVIDTRLLLASFHEGGDGNVWEMSNDGLTLEVGTNVEYASYVNDGHWTNPKGVDRRFVPGVWNGDKFQYVPGAKTGMMLKQHWVEGTHYFDSAVRIFERMFPDIIEAKMQEWIDRYF